MAMRAPDGAKKELDNNGRLYAEKVGLRRQQCRDQREWVFEVREVKSENKKLSLFFEKCKVKLKRLEIENEK